MSSFLSKNCPSDRKLRTYSNALPFFLRNFLQVQVIDSYKIKNQLHHLPGKYNLFVEKYLKYLASKMYGTEKSTHDLTT